MSRSAGSQSSAHHIVAYVAALKDTNAWRERAGGVFWAETAPRGRTMVIWALAVILVTVIECYI